MSSPNVIPIKAAEPLPDLLILDSDGSVMLGTSLRSWNVGAAITEPAAIAALAGVPGRRYRLIKEQT
jgi:hypothetical protein